MTGSTLAIASIRPPLLQRRGRRRAGAHAHPAHLIGSHARARQHQAGKPLRGRIQGRDADAQAAQVARVAKLGQRRATHAHDRLRRAPQQCEGTAVDAALAQDHGVLVGASHQVCVAADHRLLGRASARVVLQIDAQPLVAKKVELLGNGERQVIQRAQATHRQRHARALQPRLRPQRRAGQQPERGCRRQPAATLEIGERAGVGHDTLRLASSGPRPYPSGGARASGRARMGFSLMPSSPRSANCPRPSDSSQIPP